MAPTSTVHLIRHGEGYNQNDTSCRDADLTPRGIEECKEFCARFSRHEQIDLVCASPMRRALRTALISFAPEVERGLRIFALPDAQECTEDISDTGSPLSKLKEEFSDDIDMSNVTEDWYVKSGSHAVDLASSHARAKRLRRWLREQKEVEIVLVSHGQFLHFVAGNIDKDGNQTGAYWINVLERSFHFASASDDNAELVETQESRDRMAAGHGSATD